MRSIGFAYAAAAAIGNSCIDGSRKFASQRFTTVELISLVGLLDAVLLVAVVLASGNYGSVNTLLVVLDIQFLQIVVVSAGIKVLAGFLYQRALHLSPLSVTVPYLAFTPVLLVFTSFVMMHEEPSYQGLLGVVVVTIGGYLLALEQPGETETKREKPKAKVWNTLLVSFRSIVSKLRVSLLGGKDKVYSVEDQDKWEEQASKENVNILIADQKEQTLTSSFNITGTKTSQARTEWNILDWIMEPLRALKREQGSLLMLGVAGLLSVSNSLDKMGAHLARSPIVFAAIQKVIMAIPLTFFLGLVSPSSFKHLFGQFHVLFSITLFEVLAFICYLKSLETLLVAYSIAAKRSNVLITVFIGRLVFKEKILKRLPFILLMIGGMALIVLA
ncbi:hypothetical protein L7F22_012678 [Adiantum nelumboides]|nr:hypothetical protein [Adiantum nelumboides]